MTTVLLEIDDTAHCRRPGVDAEKFFPTKGANFSQVAEAKRMCNGWPSGDACPFRDKCREYGVRNAVSGIWGGWAEDERKAERKRRRIVPEPLSTGGAYPVRTTAQIPARADACALLSCGHCGKEMLPKTIARHIRTVHLKETA